MSPYERMAEKYQLHPQEQSFEWYCQWHFKHGFVFSTPDFFIMGRDVIRSPDDHWMLNFVMRPHRDTCDTWYIHAFAGHMSKAWSILPWPLPWVAFERVREGKRELTFVELERLRRLTMQTTMEAVA